MKNKIKAYQITVPLAYKIVVWGLLSAFMFLVRTFEIQMISQAGPQIASLPIIIGSLLYITIAVFADFFLFGGTYGKMKGAFDFFKHSNEGIQIAKSIYVTDVLVKSILAFVCSSFVFMYPGVDPVMLIGNGILVAGSVLLFSVVVRFISVWNFAIFPTYGAAGYYAIFAAMTFGDGKMVLGYVIAFSSLIVGAFLLIWNANRKIKESYHD